MKKKVTTLGLLVGAAALTLPSAPEANADVVMVQAADPQDPAQTRIRNGIEVLQSIDEEHTPEQATFAFDPVNKATGVVVMMNTGRLDGAAGPNLGDQIQVGNIQGACMPITLVQDTSTASGLSLIPNKENFKYVSQRQSDENRAYHHPEIEAIGNGYFAITQNWDRNDNTNTERYIQIVDSECNLQQLTGNVTRRENNTSAVIMAKNNDNCSGRQAGGGGTIYTDGAGVTHMLSAELCNGNGADDGWANYFTVENTAPGVFDIQKQWDTSFIDQEERSRGRCELVSTAGGAPDLGVCCGTEGNSQPQRDGVWCSGIDMATGDELWKEQVAYRSETASGQRTYAMRIKMIQEQTVLGENTGNIMIEYQYHRGNNNNNAKGGYDDAVMFLKAVPTRAGLNMGVHQDITDAVIKSQVEMTHSVMFQNYTGTTDNPITTFGFLAPNHNGGGGVTSSIMQVPMTAAGLPGDAVLHNLSGPIDGQKYSKYLGDNPNNQGRNYTDCHVVPNPFAATVGARTEGVPVINMCAMTGKLTTAGIPSMKPDLFFEIWTSLETPSVDEPGDGGGDDTGNGDGSGNGDGTGDGTGGNDNGGNSGFGSSGGCSTSGGSTGGLSFLFLGLALVGLRRRRSL